MAELSKSQVDRLGERLKSDVHTQTDLRMLDEYRESFSEAFESVLQVIRQRSVSPTGRIAKSTRSIVEKLRRESIRLSQMQDIAGCRIIVANIAEQDTFVSALKADFSGALVTDRRETPSHGYRAVHVILSSSGKQVEVQVRTFIQHLWAELSEKASDVLDAKIKYGDGPAKWVRILRSSSTLVQAHERLEVSHFDVERAGRKLLKANKKLRTAINEYINLDPPLEVVIQERAKLEEMTCKEEASKMEIEQMRVDLARSNERIVRRLSSMIQLLERRRENSNDLSD